MEGIIFPWQPVIVAACMMILDIISGFAGAAKNKAIKSEKMREGLWHKAGYCGLIILAFVYEIATLWIDFEMNSLGLDIVVPELPAVVAVCVFIIATEAVSVLENLCELNPAIAELPIIKALKPHDPDSADIDVEIKKEGTE